METFTEWYNREGINNDIENHKKICEQCKYIASVPDISSPDYENWKSAESSGCEILNIIVDQDVTDLIGKCSQEHKCKYCGAMTTQPDEECYMLIDKNMITKTNNYKVSIHNPWCPYGTVIKHEDRDELLDYEEYPNIFYPIYKFETGEEVIEGDLIWVVKFNGYIRQRKFNPTKKYTNIFPCYTSAFDYFINNNVAKESFQKLFPKVVLYGRSK